MIIDCHCHAGSGDGLTGPWDTRAPLGDYLRRAARAGIDRTVLFAAFGSDYEAANREVASIVARHPGRFYGFAFVHAARDRGRVAAMVSTAVRELGFRGIKVHRHDARISREVCAAARAHRVPVLYDVAGEVETLELLAQEYPDVDFIVPHLGSFADDWRAQLAAIDHVSRHPNVYADTSGVRRFDLLAQCVRRAGARKVLFGTDGPWLHPAVELEKVNALGLPPAERALILGGNFLRLIRRAQTTRRDTMVPHELTSESFEYSFEGELTAEATLTEHELQELAAELLEVGSEAELEQFIGKMFKSIGKGLKKVGGFVGKGLKTLGKGLKVMAPTLLSFAGKAVGSAFGGPLGGMIGSKLGSFAGNLIKKAEMEVAEAEEREFEAAKNFIRFADLAAQHLSRMPPTVDGEAAAMTAMERAAAQIAPTGAAKPTRAGGRWVRRGRAILLDL